MRLIAAVMVLSTFILPSTTRAQIAPRTPPSGEHVPDILDAPLLPSRPPVGRELRKAREGIDRGRRNGDLSKRDSRALRREAGDINMLADRYGSDGLSEVERRELEMRARVLQNRIDLERLKPQGKD